LDLHAKPVDIGAQDAERVEGAVRFRSEVIGGRADLDE
jgi:hypothetical protein